MSALFVALRPPPDLRAALVSLMEGVAGARWQDDAQLHLTLRYLGAVPQRQIADVHDALAQVRQAAVTIAGRGVGAFGGDARSNALWAGVAPEAPLVALHRKIDRALVMAGLPPEGRAYRPHITVARIGRGAAGPGEIGGWQARHAAFATEPVTIGHLTLFESVPGTRGSIYETLARWPLHEPTPA